MSLGLLAWPLPAIAADVPSERMAIDWQVFGSPPNYILDGPARGQGALDRSLREVAIPMLPEFDHRIHEVPYRRLEVNMRIQPTACVLGLLKTPERETYMQFSRPLLPALTGLGVLIRRDHLQALKSALTETRQLSLKRLLSMDNVRLGLAPGRSYGPTVDELLQTAPGSVQLQGVSTSTPLRNLVEMTLLGRVDVTLLFPQEVRYLQDTEGRKFPDLVFLPLEEQSTSTAAHAACAKGPAGEQIIGKINAAMTRPEAQAKLAAIRRNLQIDAGGAVLPAYAFVAGLKSSLPDIDVQVLIEMFQARRQVLAKGTGTRLYLAGGSSRDRIIRDVLHWEPVRYTSAWSALQFAGKARAPVEVDDVGALRDALRQNPDAVGLVQLTDADSTLRILAVY
jgi:uncharacterized protein (TIGR02285 family)